MNHTNNKRRNCEKLMLRHIWLPLLHFPVECGLHAPLRLGGKLWKIMPWGLRIPLRCPRLHGDDDPKHHTLLNSDIDNMVSLTRPARAGKALLKPYHECVVLQRTSPRKSEWPSLRPTPFLKPSGHHHCLSHHAL